MKGIKTHVQSHLKFAYRNSVIQGEQEIRDIDQALGQDGWILAEFGNFCVFVERGQYPAILTEKAWSIKDLDLAEGEIFIAGHGGKIAPSWPLG